jgi:hypothetical protein
MINPLTPTVMIFAIALTNGIGIPSSNVLSFGIDEGEKENVKNFLKEIEEYRVGTKQYSQGPNLLETEYSYVDNITDELIRIYVTKRI